MIFLGIGSNLSSSYGDRFKNISLAVQKIEEFHIKIHKKSSYYETFSLHTYYMLANKATYCLIMLHSCEVLYTVSYTK